MVKIFGVALTPWVICAAVMEVVCGNTALIVVLRLLTLPVASIEENCTDAERSTPLTRTFETLT